jgi:hypothetical protein
MSVKLPCGCRDTTMCPVHEKEWWDRHREALARQAAAHVDSEVKTDDWMNN